ncbi:WD40 repeat-like protein [Cryphonectria parasitica EP155]|uniref:WD40 repeat-like protein n=1 Tax=Cryphonectria parasitica (strain ATCC 38755 / EP155) TaxID=660469 RepID=A0A9P4XSY5_CRYP1|nr:WD40 repeat-like protein [Cryphonectria parasitica EP155]KAF3760642.1 WD40 repeat-like protein [Cryphonectria parasitica EP155]
MAAEVRPLPQLKLPSAPQAITAEQRYWKTFKNQKSHTTTASWGVTHISFPSPSSSSSSSSSTAARNNDLFAVTAGPRVDVYSIRRREPLKTIGRFDSVARSGEIRADSRVLVAGDDSGKMQVFDVAGGARAVVLKTWHVHKQPVWVTRWSPSDLTTLMSASDDRTVRLWDLPGQEATRQFVGHQDYVRSGAFMPGGLGASSNMLVTGSYDATVKIWDARVPNGSVLTFKHAAPVEEVLPLPTGTTVLAAADNAISVLDLVAARVQRVITNHQKTVTSLCLASNGRRVVSGGLDGHVKIFETGSWNVVAGAKYPSPILSLSVITAGANAADRHLAVGMQSGVLSLKTRLTGSAAEKERERARAAAVTDLSQLDVAKSTKRKRKEILTRSLAAVDRDVDFLIDKDAHGRPAKERQWQYDLRHGKYAAALDGVLDTAAPDHSKLNVLTLLHALRHRSALRAALEHRDEVSVRPVMHWISNHIIDPRYRSACVDVGLHLLDLYAEHAGASTELAAAFKTLRKRVTQEVEKAQVAAQTGGMVEALMIAGEEA